MARLTHDGDRSTVLTMSGQGILGASGVQVANFGAVSQLSETGDVDGRMKQTNLAGW